MQEARGRSGFEEISSPALTALAAVFQLAILAGRLPLPASSSKPTAHLIWQGPMLASPGDHPPTSTMPSNPIYTFCAGHLALAAGMAVLALAAWLQILHVSGARGQ